MSIIQQNHALLMDFGISSLTIEDLVEQFTKEGKVTSKITGSGMGGFVLVIGRKDVLD